MLSVFVFFKFSSEPKARPCSSKMPQISQLSDIDRVSVALFAFGRLPACSQIPTFHAAASPPTSPIFFCWGWRVLESLCSFVAFVAEILGSWRISNETWKQKCRRLMERNAMENPKSLGFRSGPKETQKNSSQPSIPCDSWWIGATH